MKYYVYTLSCPITKKVRYVGITKDLKKRFGNHLCVDNKPNSYRNSWIKSLKTKGLKPVMEELESTSSLEDVFKLEIYWISQFKSWGFNLVNKTDGGEGVYGMVVSQETRDKLSKSLKERYSKEPHKNKGVKWSEERKLGKSLAWKTNNNMKNGLNTVHSSNKKPIIQMTLDFQFIKEHPSIKEAGIAVGVAASGISDVLNKNDRSTKGFKWKYKENL